MNCCLKCCILLLMLARLKYLLKWVSWKDLCVLLITEYDPACFSKVLSTKERWASNSWVLIRM